MINATIVGRITKDLQVRTVMIGDKATPVLNFTLACDDGNRVDKDGKRIGTEFIRVTAWRGAADAIAKYCYKGRAMAVAGAIHLGKYADQQNGGLHYNLTVPSPTMFEFLGANNEVEKKVANDIPEEVENGTVDPLETPWDD